MASWRRTSLPSASPSTTSCDPPRRPVHTSQTCPCGRPAWGALTNSASVYTPVQGGFFLPVGSLLPVPGGGPEHVPSPSTTRDTAIVADDTAVFVSEPRPSTGILDVCDLWTGQHPQPTTRESCFLAWFGDLQMGGLRPPLGFGSHRYLRALHGQQARASVPRGQYTGPAHTHLGAQRLALTSVWPRGSL